MFQKVWLVLLLREKCTMHAHILRFLVWRRSVAPNRGQKSDIWDKKVGHSYLNISAIWTFIICRTLCVWVTYKLKNVWRIKYHKKQICFLCTSFYYFSSKLHFTNDATVMYKIKRREKIENDEESMVTRLLITTIYKIFVCQYTSNEWQLRVWGSWFFIIQCTGVRVDGTITYLVWIIELLRETRNCI